MTKQERAHKENPRYDLLTGELIRYKNEEFYLTSYFNTRANMLKYFKDNALESNNLYKLTKDMLSARKTVKNLKYAPSTVELRSCILPSIALLDKVKINYKDICIDLGLEVKYDYDINLTYKNIEPTFLIDTREQLPLKIKNSNVQKLEFGDITVASPLFNQVFIERKSLVDLVGSISQGYERIQREIERAANVGCYLIFAVESDLNDSLSLEYQPQLRRSKATASFIFHRIRELMQKYTNIQFVFFNGRKVMVDKLKRIFLIEQDITKLDLQYLLDKKKI